MINPKKKYLITGGAGFLGTALIKRLEAMGCFNLVTVSRNEGKLVELEEKFRFIETIPGDITDPFVVQKACKGVDGIFHLAAFKHVGMAEKNVLQCVQSNVVGTMNLLEETRRTKPDFIIGISTDKAAQVKGVYGATKMLQERLFNEYEGMNGPTKYRTVRYGNVLYSTGSVLCKWKEALQKGDEITLTDENATRFYWTVDQAVDLIFECLEKGTDSKPYHVPMKAMTLGSLLTAMAKKYLKPGASLRIRRIGLQQGENMHEVIDESGQDSSKAPQYTPKEILELI